MKAADKLLAKYGYRPDGKKMTAHEKKKSAAAKKKKQSFKKRCRNLISDRLKKSKPIRDERKKSEPSVFEARIAEYLVSNNVRFIREWSSPFLYSHKTQHQLFFDFYLPDYKAAIEFDGVHHFKNSDPDKLDRQKYNDARKNIYCKRNGVKLLRIPCFRSAEIEQIICEFFDKNYSG